MPRTSRRTIPVLLGFASLLSCLTAGSLEKARQIGKVLTDAAEHLLEKKLGDPLAAAVAG